LNGYITKTQYIQRTLNGRITKTQYIQRTLNGRITKTQNTQRTLNGRITKTQYTGQKEHEEVTHCRRANDDVNLDTMIQGATYDTRQHTHTEIYISETKAQRTEVIHRTK
jgi:hypothetical protein